MIWFMPFLPFEAIDANGKTIKGTIQADNAQQLELILLQKGLRLIAHSMQPPPQQARPVQQARPMQQAQPVQQARPVQSPAIAQSQPRQISRESPTAPQRINISTAASQTATIKTPELTNKQTYFLFAQFASFFRAGFSSSQMIPQATATLPSKFRPAFAEMENEVAQGMTLSESMSRRPMLFHPDQIGRAHV